MSTAKQVAENAKSLLSDFTEMVSQIEKKYTEPPLFCTGAFAFCYDSDGRNERPDFGSAPFDREYAYWLGVQKIDGKWRLAWSETPDSEYYEPVGWVPLSSAPLQERLGAIAALPKMETLMVNHNQRMNDRLAKANQQLRELL